MTKGRYGGYGGQYISEILMNELIELEKQFNYYMNDQDFIDELNLLLNLFMSPTSAKSKAVVKSLNPGIELIILNSGLSFI